MTIEEKVAVDGDKLMAFVFNAVGEVGASLNLALVVMGDRLGFYHALADRGPLTPAELAEATQIGEKYVREWLNAQSAGGFVRYDPATATYELPPEQAVALTDETSPAFLPGLFQLAYGTIQDADQIIDLARSGDGFGWHEHHGDVHDGCERFFRPGYLANLVDSWLPALDGVVAKLQAGARVADMGCGYGASTVLMAQASAGVSDRITFETASATAYSGAGFDLVTTFDALHDMGDPVGAARHVYDTLAQDGTWLVVEPAAGDRVEDNLNPVGRVYYGFSTLLCTPASLAQDVGLALGTQAGPARIRDVTVAAGFRRFRTAATTPFNNVFEVRR